jgi:hypothetical protein
MEVGIFSARQAAEYMFSSPTREGGWPISAAFQWMGMKTFF